MFTWPLWEVPQEPAPADELITLRYPKSNLLPGLSGMVMLPEAILSQHSHALLFRVLLLSAVVFIELSSMTKLN